MIGGTTDASPAGDLEGLYSPFRGRVRAWLKRLLGNEADAEDAEGEILLRCAAGLRNLKKTDTFGTWLYSISRNVAREKLRKDRRARRLLEKVVAHEGAPFELSPEQLLIGGRDARKRAVVSVLNSISPKQRRLIMLILYSGFDIRQAAGELGINENAAYALYFRAVHAVRKALIERGEIDG